MPLVLVIHGFCKEWMATAQIGKLPRLPRDGLETDGTPKEKAERVAASLDVMKEPWTLIWH